jgi:hypothetical protein
MILRHDVRLSAGLTSTSRPEVEHNMHTGICLKTSEPDE